MRRTVIASRRLVVDVVAAVVEVMADAVDEGEMPPVQF